MNARRWRWVTVCAVALVALMNSPASALPVQDGDSAARVVIAPLSGAVEPGDVLTLDLTGSRLSRGLCPQSIAITWIPDPRGIPGTLEPAGRPVTAWQTTEGDAGRACDGTLPRMAVDVVVPDDFAGGSVGVTLLGAAGQGRQSWVYGSTKVSVSVPIARLFAQSNPASSSQALTLDARTSIDPSGQALRYEWDLNGDGRFGDTPGSAEPGLAVIPPSPTANGPTTRAKGMLDPGQIAAGLNRMRQCTPTTSAFVSLEVAPEVKGRPKARAGMHRLWDLKVTWRDVNPERGRFDWTVLDQRIAEVEAAGAEPLLVLGMTPQWAAVDPNAGDPRWGTGSASPPRDAEDWRAYVNAVVDRYGSRIAAYEVWNEASLRTFWTGTANEMASLTAIAHQAIKAKQPTAIVLAASVTTRLRRPMELFMNQYLDSLGGYGYPFDGFAIHTYPAGNVGPDARFDDITNWQQVVVERVGPDSPVLDKMVWDTEVNYGLAGPGPRPATAFSDEQGAELITRTYTDSRRLGIDATFWYMYTATPFSLLGVQLWSGTPTTLDAWSALRKRFAAGANPCSTPQGQSITGALPVAVKVIAPDGRSSVAQASTPVSSLLTANGSIAVPPILHQSGSLIRAQVTAPASPGAPALVACLDSTGTRHFDRPVALASGQGAISFLAPSLPGTHRLSVGFWPAAANPTCAASVVEGAVQVVGSAYSVGGGQSRANAGSRGAIEIGRSKVVSVQGVDSSGTITGAVIRGTYQLTLPAKGTSRQPDALQALESGRFAARLDWVASSAGTSGAGSASSKGRVSASGEGVVLLRGQGKSFICLRATLSPQGNSFFSIGGSGKGANLLLSIVDDGLTLSPIGKAGRKTGPGRAKASIVVASAADSTAMPASCESLRRFLR
jgi:hypothetical protein